MIEVLLQTNTHLNRVYSPPERERERENGGGGGGGGGGGRETHSQRHRPTNT